MMRTFKMALALAGALAAGCGTTKPISDGGSVAVTLAAGSACGSSIAFAVGQSTTQVTLSGTASGASAGSPVTVTDNGQTVALIAAVLNQNLAFTVSLPLPTSVPDHQLVVTVTDSGGNGSGSSVVCDVRLISNTVDAGSCSLSLSPANGTLFNETDGGTLLSGRLAVTDEDFNTPGIQAQITVSAQNCQGPVILTINGSQVGSTSPVNGTAVFDRLTLPDTSVHAFAIADGGDQVVASADGTSAAAQYFADSLIPAATITSPVSGRFTMGNDAGVLSLNVAGTTVGFDLADGPVGYQIFDVDAGVPLTPAGALDDGGAFAAKTSSLLNGNHFLAFVGKNLSGNSATSNLVQLAVALPTTLLFGPGLPPTAPQVLNHAFDFDLQTAGFQLLLPLITNAVTGSTVFLCSTVKPTTSAVQGGCPAGQFVVGSAAVGGSSAVSVPVTLGQGAQTLSCYVSVGNVTTAGPTLALIVHSLTPLIEQLTFSGLYQDDAGRRWVNAADLIDAGVAAFQLAVVVDSVDQYSDGGGLFGQVLVTSASGGASAVAAVDGGSASAPEADLVVLVPAGVQTYQLSVQASDLWGNASSTIDGGNPVPTNFTVFVKTSAPSCALTSPGACFTVADNSGNMTSGSANVGVPASATNAAGPDDPATSLPVPGLLEVGVGGSVDGGSAAVTAANFSLPIAVSSPQGSASYAGLVVDPAGNPPVACTGSFSLTVATVDPMVGVTVSADPNTPAMDGNTQIYTSTRMVTATLTNNGATGNLTAYIAASPTGAPLGAGAVSVPSSASSVSVPNAPNSPSSGVEYLVVKGTDSCGNPAFSAVPVEVNVPGCDLTLVSPQPTVVDGVSEVVFNGAPPGMVANGQLSTSLNFHSSCPSTGVTITFGGGNSNPSTDGNGDLAFALNNLPDGASGTLSATVAGANGVTIGPLPYIVKLTSPAIGILQPAIATVQIVANQDNPLDGGSASLLVEANAIASSANAAGTFAVSLDGGLGPTDSNGHVGTATLTATFPGAAATTLTAAIAAGDNRATFSPTNLPPLSFPQSGTVVLSVTDNAGNSVSQTWTVTTDVVPPPAPTATAAMSDQRKANVLLSWTVPPLGSASATVGYELRYQIANPAQAALGTPSGATYASMIAVNDAALANDSAAAGRALTYTVKNLPTLNQYGFELRAVDGVGNRSALGAAANATSCTINAANPGICTGGTNQWTTLVIAGPANQSNGGQDVGFRMKTGDFNNDGKQDLVISAPARGTNDGSVYILPGAGSYAGVPLTWPWASPFVKLTLATANNTDQFGRDIAVGDFNGDKIDDLAVGAPLWGAGTASGQGEVAIYFGSASGLPTTPSVVIEGVTATGNFGWSVSNLKDINNDGFDDLLIGAPLDGPNQNGTVYLYLGQANWPAAPTATTAIVGNPDDVVGGHWGNVRLGDVDSDGTLDFAVGGPGGGVDAGASGVVYGIKGAMALSNATLSVNTQPLFPPLSANVSCDSNHDYTSGYFGCFGASAVSGNFTGGALPDLVVASLSAGQIWFYKDVKPTGPSPFVFTDSPPSLDYGFTMTPTDLNGDGNLDLIVGSNDYTVATVHFYINTGTGLTASTGPAPSGATIVGTPNSSLGYGTAAGDLRGLGLTDFVLSDPFVAAIYIYY